MREGDIQRRIQLACSGEEVRLFRNTVGMGWMGNVVSKDERTIMLARYRPVTFGLAPGSSDLIGLRSVIVTPEMVGQRVAVFGAVEVKTESGRPTAEQRAFIDTVQQLGGMAGIAHNEAEAREILRL